MIRLILVFYLCLISSGLLTGLKLSDATGRDSQKRLQHRRQLKQIGDKDEKSDYNRKILSSILAVDEKTPSMSSSSILPYAALAIVPIIWGTYTPVVKSLFALDIPPPGLIFNFLSYTVSFLSLSSATWILSSSNNGDNVEIETSASSSSQVSIIGGFELGMWLFLGSSAQVMGIQSTTAIKASILVQLTTVFVPVLESVLGTYQRALTPKLWLSCILAFVSVAMISSNGANSLEGFLQFEQGDLMIILSSLFYSMHVIRLGKYAVNVDPIRLARSKAFFELLLSFCTIFFCVFILGQYELGEYVNKLLVDSDSVRWDVLSMTVLWNGAITTAATMYCQSYGQRKVRPTEANLIYTSQPVWAILFAYYFLGERIDVAILPAVALLFCSIGISLFETSNNNDDDINNIKKEIDDYLETS